MHQTIIQFSEHRRLQEQYKIIEQQIRLYIASCNALYPSFDGIVEQHKMLVKAICSGDAAIAEQIAKGHNADGKALVEYLQALERKTPRQEKELNK
ncbi:MAG: FCD domain-containing protein [Chroococcidiopsidaceae cyanobacterium CP_BM_RX_35]|nr:FCD domain-containing protein [Chroococcidiopsidaceae cyanobacterium CP_BM_RX_35]